MIKFITYLHGSPSWSRCAPMLEPSYPGVPSWIRDLLGLDDVNMCACLYRLYSSTLQYSYELINTDPMSVLPGPDVLKDGILQITGTGPASVKPATPPFQAGRMCVGTVTLDMRDEYGVMAVDRYREKVTYHRVGDTVEVQWPAWLPNHGTLHVEPDATTTTIPVLWTYPIQEVDRLLRKTTDAYKFMEQYSLVELFCAEGTAEGRVCAFVRAVLQHVKYKP